MERLTKRDNNGKATPAKISTANYVGTIYEENKTLEQERLDRLAEYEDKLESGQLREINNKPLTVEKLKKLLNGDWLWIERPQYKEGDKGCYYQIASICTDGLIVWVGSQRKAFMFEDYGESWIAYKNKEEVEINSKEAKI